MVAGYPSRSTPAERPGEGDEGCGVLRGEGSLLREGFGDFPAEEGLERRLSHS